MGVTNRLGSLQESVLDTIRDVLGESTAKLIQQYLGSIQYDNVEEVHVKLTALFGNGAKVLETIIIKELRGRLGLPYEEKQPFDFQKQFGRVVKVYGEGRKVA